MLERSCDSRSETGNRHEGVMCGEWKCQENFAMHIRVWDPWGTGFPQKKNNPKNTMQKQHKKPQYTKPSLNCFFFNKRIISMITEHNKFTKKKLRILRKELTYFLIFSLVFSTAIILRRVWIYWTSHLFQNLQLNSLRNKPQWLSTK